MTRAVFAPFSCKYKRFLARAGFGGVPGDAPSGLPSGAVPGPRRGLPELPNRTLAPKITFGAENLLLVSK